MNIIPLTMIDETHLMVLSSRKWKPEPGWCLHGWRTWVMPLPKDNTHGIRFHGQEEDFGVLLEVKPRCLPIDASRQRRRPELVQRAEIKPQRKQSTAVLTADAGHATDDTGTDRHE